MLASVSLSAELWVADKAEALDSSLRPQIKLVTRPPFSLSVKNNFGSNHSFGGHHPKQAIPWLMVLPIEISAWGQMDGFSLSLDFPSILKVFKNTAS